MGRDPFQMIATVGDTLTHVYGPGDQRIWQVDHTTSTWDESWTIRDLSGNVVRRLDKIGPTWSFGQDWIRRDGSLLAAALPGGLERHYHLDHLGSARLITQQTGTTIGRFAYEPFGEDASEVSASFPETMRFTGHERDGVETAGWADDLDYMRARYCSPRWGRFLSVDPARDSARVGVPQSWNRYSYGLGNPVKYVDPDGRVAETAWDAFNIGLGIASFADNVRQGNWGAAVLDGLGVVADTAATATPFVPGGAGTAIRVSRAADRVRDSARRGSELANNAGNLSAGSSRAARREAMRREGIPTSQQPTAQSSPRGPGNRPAGRQLVYDTPEGERLVQHQLQDRNHGPHWEAGKAKPGGQTDPAGRPRLDNTKIKVDE